MGSRSLTSVRCPRCHTHPKVCICADVRPIQTDVRLLIFQHPSEVHRPSATARLVTLAVPSARIFLKDDVKDELALRAILEEPGPRPFLVFPEPGSPEAGDLREAGAWENGPPPTFLMLDGSWRQVRRMRTRKRFLSALPTVTLRPETVSNYRIRRQSHEGNLSTVEAAALLLSRVEGNPEKFRHLIELLDLMVTRTLRLRGLDFRARTSVDDGS